MLDLEVCCNDCGQSIDFEVKYHQTSVSLQVPPCPVCMEDFKKEAFEEGREAFLEG